MSVKNCINIFKNIIMKKIGSSIAKSVTNLCKATIHNNYDFVTVKEPKQFRGSQLTSCVFASAHKDISDFWYASLPKRDGATSYKEKITIELKTLKFCWEYLFLIFHRGTSTYTHVSSHCEQVAFITLKNNYEIMIRKY